MKLTIGHLYPLEMNIYGDRGNVLALVKRLQWRGIGVEVKEIAPGEKFDFTKVDIVFGGGGQDRGQLLIADDLLARQKNLRHAADDGVVMLLVCGLYQLFGRGFTTSDGHKIPGIGIFDAETKGSEHRMIGNVIVDSPFGRLVGFENHSGETLLDEDQKPLGEVIQGFGNDYVSKKEGAVYKNVFGTYLHGSLLPKNPSFADRLILTALQRRYGDKIKLKQLDDALELKASEIASKRPQ